MLARSPKYRADEGSTPEQKKSRAGTRILAQLRAPHLLLTLAFIPRQPQPSPSPLPRQRQTRFWRASVLDGFPPLPQESRFSLLSMQQPLRRILRAVRFLGHQPDTTLLLPTSAAGPGATALLSDHRAVCSPTARHFESHPILSGEPSAFTCTTPPPITSFLQRDARSARDAHRQPISGPMYTGRPHP